MSADSTKAVLRQYFEAVESGDRSIFDRILADDITYHYPGRSAFANTYHGRDEIYAYLDRLGAELNGSLTVTVDHILADGDVGVAIARPKATRKGRELEWRLVIVFTMEGSTIKRVVLNYGDQYAFDEFISA